MNWVVVKVCGSGVWYKVVQIFILSSSYAVFLSDLEFGLYGDIRSGTLHVLWVVVKFVMKWSWCRVMLGSGSLPSALSCGY